MPTPTLTIRGLPAKDYDRLRKRAAARKSSMEAEARAIMSEALAPKKKKADADWLKKVQELVAKSTKKRRSSDLLSEEFMRDRRKMWGEE